MAISIIVAMTKDRVIGAGGEIPWHIADDMRMFKSLTEGNTVIMGKRTWLSIPDEFRPLPGRENIVVSTTLGEQRGAKVCRSVAEAVKEAKKTGREIYCAGGARLYAAMLPLADTMYISWVKGEYDGDTYFPEVDLTKWKEVETREFPDFVFKKYSRAKS
jgi:dihydrofolate reductase